MNPTGGGRSRGSSDKLQDIRQVDIQIQDYLTVGTFTSTVPSESRKKINNGDLVSHYDFHHTCLQ